jgi:hypothetical protein
VNLKLLDYWEKPLRNQRKKRPLKEFYPPFHYLPEDSLAEGFIQFEKLTCALGKYTSINIKGNYLPSRDD